MADRPRSLDALRRAAYQMHADHEHDMATDPKYAAVVRRIGRSGALRSEDYQRAVQIAHANEHNTYSDQSGMSTTEAADLTADLARGASGDA
jgi:hypothetical protein